MPGKGNKGGKAFLVVKQVRKDVNVPIGKGKGRGRPKGKGKGGGKGPKFHAEPSVLKAALDNSQGGFTESKGPPQGHGGYFGDLLGGMGSKLGDWLSDKATKMIGLGDYADDTKVSSHDLSCNSLCAGTPAPVIQNKGQAFIMRHREYVTDVVSSVNFTVSQFLINPGNTKLFPWLCALAPAFEEYQIIGMIAEFKPLISLTSTNANGAVVFATEYNVTKPAFTSKIAMENYEYATSCAPYQSMMHAIECAPAQTAMGSTHRYVLNGNVPAGQDARLYQLGNLQIATQGQASATVIGEFWITYEIAFFKPLFAVGQGLNLLTDKWGATVVNGGNTNAFQGLSQAVLNSSYKSGSLLGTQFTTSGVGQPVFPSSVSIGTYLVSLSLYPTAAWTAAVSFTAPTITNGNLLQVWNGDTNTQFVGTCPSGSFDALGITFMFQVSAPGALLCSFLFSNLTNAVTNTYNMDMVITQINGSIIS